MLAAALVIARALGYSERTSSTGWYTDADGNQVREARLKTGVNSADEWVCKQIITPSGEVGGGCEKAVQPQDPVTEPPPSSPPLVPLDEPDPFRLAMNIHPSDGEDFGWCKWPMDGAARGSSPLGGDYVDATNYARPADYIAVARHTDGACSASRVWRLKVAGTSLYDVFKSDSTYQRAELTEGGVVSQVVHNTSGVQGSATPDDPIFGCAGDIVVNWSPSTPPSPSRRPPCPRAPTPSLSPTSRLYCDRRWHSNNGVRIALDCGNLSPATANDDDTHGLGNEFGGTTHSNGKATNGANGQWSHDAAKLQPDCHGGSCIILGTDHGTNLNDGPSYGQYSIWVGNSSTFACPATGTMTVDN